MCRTTSPAGEGNDAKRRCTTLRSDMSIEGRKGPAGAETTRRRDSWAHRGFIQGAFKVHSRFAQGSFKVRSRLENGRKPAECSMFKRRIRIYARFCRLPHRPPQSENVCMATTISPVDRQLEFPALATRGQSCKKSVAKCCKTLRSNTRAGEESGPIPSSVWDLGFNYPLPAPAPCPYCTSHAIEEYTERPETSRLTRCVSTSYNNGKQTAPRTRNAGAVQ